MVVLKTQFAESKSLALYITHSFDSCLRQWNWNSLPTEGKADDSDLIR